MPFLARRLCARAERPVDNKAYRSPPSAAGLGAPALEQQPVSNMGKWADSLGVCARGLCQGQLQGRRDGPAAGARLRRIVGENSSFQTRTYVALAG
jgi:hypothetical protein